MAEDTPTAEIPPTPRRRGFSWWRFILALPALGAIGWFLQQEQASGRFQQVDELFEDFLIANSRDHFEKPTAQPAESPVVLIRLREEDTAEYASWPPPPLDWRMILEGLKDYHPEVLVITQPLNWGRPAPEFLPALADSLLAFPSVALGMEGEITAAGAAKADAPSAFTGGLDAALPAFTHISGDSSGAPQLSALVSPPAEPLRHQAELGLVLRAADSSPRLPYAVRIGEKLHPTLIAQALSRATRSPFAAQRLRFGAGAGVRLADGSFVPLTPQADLAIQSDPPAVPLINALDLMTGGLTDALSPENKAHLKAAKVIVIGVDTDIAGRPLSTARLHAQALTQALSVPRIQTLDQQQQWIAWGIAALAGLWIAARTRRARALATGILFILAALTACLLAFQSQLIWCPPTLPAALIAAGAVLALLWGAGKGTSDH